MCGILGTINQPIDSSLLDMIKHRGPDDSGLIPLVVGSCEITLGHRRLAIVDLSPAGHQPMFDLSGNYSIIFNGEIYNHLELRQRIDNVAFNGHSDTETILYLLAQKGIDAVRDLNGIFSFGFIDKVKGTLYLVRDPFGVKPLYYSKDEDQLVFASELKPMLKLVGNEVNVENLAELLRLRFSPSPDTLFQKIRKVRPGHIVEINLKNPNLEIREYSYLRATPSQVKVSQTEAAAQYGLKFELAIERQLMSDVEVGVLLSGGIDSALVAAIAQRHSVKPLKAFTIGFSESDDSDEIEDARETAELLGMEHHVIRMGFDDFLGTIKRCVAIVEEPVATTSVIPMYHLAELAAKHVKVVLTGQGADEPLGGYGRYQGEIYRNFFPPTLAKMLSPMVQLLGVKNDQILRGLKALSEKEDLPRFLQAYEVFSYDEIERLTGCKEMKARQRLEYFYNLLACSKLNTSVERMMSLDLRMNLSDDLLLYTDKITMHHSIECRVPMLDLELINFIESLPASYRVQRNRTKIIHRDYATKILPSAIINRRKKGFQSPTKTWFKKGKIREILLDSSSQFSSYFDLKYVAKILDQHAQGYDLERQIFLLLSIYFWMQTYDAKS